MLIPNKLNISIEKTNDNIFHSIVTSEITPGIEGSAYHTELKVSVNKAIDCFKTLFTRLTIE